MTTIAYSQGVILVDSKAYSGGKEPLGHKQKLHRLPNGWFAGSSTVVGAPERLRDALAENGPRVHDSYEHPVDAFYLQDSGELWGFLQGTAWVLLDEKDTLFLGSGAQYAQGASKAGCGALESLEIACELDPWSGLPLSQSYDIEPTKAKKSWFS